MRRRTVSKHASWWKEWAKLGCPNPVRRSASLVGMVRLQSKLAPVRTARGWCACVKDSNFGNFCPIDMKPVSFERALRRLLNQVLFVAMKQLFLKILYPEWCSNSTLWSNWLCWLYGGNKVLYKRSYLSVQKSDHNPWCQGIFCCIGKGVPHQWLMGYGEPFLWG